MFINKMGSYHKEYGINNQDFGFQLDNIDCVVDGCSSSQHSEIGAKLFCKYLKEILEYYLKGEYLSAETAKLLPFFVDSIFKKLIKSLDLEGSKEIIDYLAFTIIIHIKFAFGDVIYYAGDGFIIRMNDNAPLIYESLGDNNTPTYYVYKFIEQEHFQKQELGLKKIEYSLAGRIGIATDGLRYIAGNAIQKEFEDILLEDNEIKMKRFMNKNQQILKDDITVAL